MADASVGIYDVEGHKISLQVLTDFSGLLPPEASEIVQRAQDVITTIRVIPSNRDEAPLFRTYLLKGVLVVLSALCEQIIGDEDPPTIPADLQAHVSHFKYALDNIKKELSNTQAVVASPPKHRKGKASFVVASQTPLLQGCKQALREAMAPFGVEINFIYAARLCAIFRKKHQPALNNLIEKVPRATYARFDCVRPDQPSSCFKGTRIAIIKEIIQWIANPDVERLFWLNGLAGIGKTTIAFTIAKLARSLGILGASFLFSRRGEASLRNPALVFPTLAYQLARFDPEFGQRISDALKADPEAPTAPLKQQRDRLIVDPLCGLERDSSKVVIIVFDAFDECEAIGAKTILQLLIDAIPRLPFFLKVFITSRPEKHIRSVLDPPNNHLRNLRVAILHNIDAAVVKNDIRLYLRARLRSLPAEKGDDLPEGWVTDHEVELLVDAANNLFIYAETALRFLSNAFNLRGQFDVLLQIITSHAPTDGTIVFLSLDELYMEVLRALITPTNRIEALRLLQGVLGSIVLLRDPLPADALERLTGLKKNDVGSILGLLHSVILPPSPPDNCPRLYHPSFSDFLRDPTRCTDSELCIDTQKHERRLAMKCLQLLNQELRKGILGHVNPMLLNSEVKDLDSKIRAAFLPELGHACRHWASYLAASGPGDCELLACLVTFAASVMLPWLESMSWLGEMRLAVESLESARLYTASQPHLLETSTLLNDGYRLLLAHYSTIERGAQHISRSVLPFVPRGTGIASRFKEYVDGSFRVIGVTDLEWDLCFFTLTGHSSAVKFAVFSPDGSRLASESEDGTTRVWDASTGGHLLTLASHSSAVQPIVFSSNSSRLISASGDRTVRVWDASTGEQLFTLNGDSDATISVVFSPDGSQVASTYRNGEARIWDTSTDGHLVYVIDRAFAVASIMFSPDGSRLASVSHKKLVHIWDASTGERLLTLSGHGNYIRFVVFSPNGSRLASVSNDKTVRVWDTSAGDHVSTFSSDAMSVRFSPDGTRLASLFRNKRVHLQDVSTHQPLFTFRCPSSFTKSIAFSSDGSRLASVSNDKTVQVWDASTGADLFTLTGHSSVINSVTFSPDGSRLVSASADKTVRVWDASAGYHLTTLTGHSSTIVSVVFSPDGSRLASTSDDRTVRIWDFSTASSYHTSDHSSRAARTFPPHQMETEQVWDVHTGRCIITLTTHPNPSPISCVKFTIKSLKQTRVNKDPPGEVRLSPFSTGPLPPGDFDSVTFLSDDALTSKEKEAVLLQKDCAWLLEEWTRLHAQCLRFEARVTLPEENEEDSEPPNLIEAQEDIQLLETKFWRGELRREEMEESRAKVTSLRELLSRYEKEVMRRGGDIKILLTARHPPVVPRFLATVYVWDRDTYPQSPIATLTGHCTPIHHDPVSCDHIITLIRHSSTSDLIGFSPDGSRLASVSSNGTVRVWELSTAVKDYASDHASGSSSACLPREVTSHGLVWNVSAGRCITMFAEDSKPVDHIWFSQDGSRLIVRSWDQMRVWNTSTGSAVTTFSSFAFSGGDFTLDTALQPIWTSSAFGSSLKGYTGFVKVPQIGLVATTESPLDLMNVSCEFEIRGDELIKRGSDQRICILPAAYGVHKVASFPVKKHRYCILLTCADRRVLVVFLDTALSIS